MTITLIVLGSRRTAAQSATTPDPIVGKWYGMAGFPTDRVPIGFEVKQSSTGTLTIYLYQPVINFYGLELGHLTRDGDRYRLTEMSLSFALHDGVLDGEYMSLKAPMTLRRTTRLPAEVPLPKLPTGPGPLWRTGLGGSIYAPVAVHDGHAYVGTTGGAFYSLSLANGAMEWMFIAGRPIHGEATVTDDAVFFVADNGFLFKVARATGKEVWRYDLGDARVDRVLGHPETEDFDWDFEAPKPVLSGGTLYVGSSDGSFHAVSAAAGARVWRVETGSKIRSTALVRDSSVLFGNWNGDLLLVDRRTGSTIWKKSVRMPVTSTGVMVGERIVIGTRGGVLYALEPATGNVIWRSGFWGSAVESDAEPVGDRFYIGSSDLRRVALIDAADGSIRWRTDVFGMPWAKPAASDSVVYVSVTGSKVGKIRHVGSLTLLDGSTGRAIWSWRMPDWPGALFTGFTAAPTIAGDHVVVGGVDGSVYAFPRVPSRRAAEPTRP